MLKGRSNTPDFDPFLSPSSGFWSDVPPSAIAERIFNDPDSWDDTSGDEGDYPEDIEDDTVTWLTEEIEKIRIHSAGVGGNGNFERNTSDKKAGKRDSLIPNAGAKDGWKSIGRPSALRPISLAGFFEQANTDFTKEVQQHLSKILNSGGIKHQIGPLPLSATGLNTADSSSTASSPVSSSVDDVFYPPYPPSATLSFLEFYGIYPESPRVDGRDSLLPRMKTIRKAAKNKEAPSRNDVPAATLTSEPIATKLPSSPLNLPVPPEVSPTDDLQLRGNPPGLPKPPTYESPRLHDNPQDQGRLSPLSHHSDPSPRSRPLPNTATPPCGQTTRLSTPNIITSNPASMPPVRRLPSVPQAAQNQTNSVPPSNKITRTDGTPPSQAPAAFPPPVQIGGAWSFGSFTLTPESSSPQTPHSLFGARSPPSFRSPASVPLGPRTRARSADAGRPITTV